MQRLYYTNCQYKKLIHEIRNLDNLPLCFSYLISKL